MLRTGTLPDPVSPRLSHCAAAESSRPTAARPPKLLPPKPRFHPNSCSRVPCAHEPVPAARVGSRQLSTRRHDRAAAPYCLGNYSKGPNLGSIPGSASKGLTSPRVRRPELKIAIEWEGVSRRPSLLLPPRRLAVGAHRTLRTISLASFVDSLPHICRGLPPLGDNFLLILFPPRCSFSKCGAINSGPSIAA